MDTNEAAYKLAFRLNEACGALSLISHESGDFKRGAASDNASGAAALETIQKAAQQAALETMRLNGEVLESVINLGYDNALRELARADRVCEDAAYLIFVRELVRQCAAEEKWLSPDQAPDEKRTLPDFRAKSVVASGDDSDVQAALEKAVESSSYGTQAAWRKVNRQNNKIDNMTEREYQNRLDDLRTMITSRAHHFGKSAFLQRKIDEYEAMRLRRTESFAVYCKRYSIGIHTAYDLIA